MPDKENRPDHHQGIAAVLSFVYNGLGQLYNGQIKKGLLLVFLSSTAMVLTIVGAILLGYCIFTQSALGRELLFGVGLFFAGITLMCGVGTYSIFDAYRNG